MYANATPHASTAHSAQALHTAAAQPLPAHAQPGHHQQQPTTWQQQPSTMPAPTQTAASTHITDQHRARQATSLVTGAYQLSGDPGIDRMIRLERALKQFGSAF